MPSELCRQAIAWRRRSFTAFRMTKNTIRPLFYGNHYVYAKGSTPVRTRLYQMSIAGLLEEISIDFDVYGVIDDIAYSFQKNVNYDAFLVKKK